MYCDIDALVESANTVLAAKEKITPALLSKVFPLGKDSVRKLDARQIAEFMQERNPCSVFAVYFYELLSRCVEKRYIVIGNILLRFFEVLWYSLQSNLFALRKEERRKEEKKRNPNATKKREKTAKTYT